MLSRLSVRKPYTVLVAVALIAVLAFLSFRDMKTDLLPKMEFPYAIVMTTYIGASPEEVESSVTKPIEQAMASISNIKNISSSSRDNASVVILEFTQTANMDSVTIEMRESLDTLTAPWEESIGNPIIMKINPDIMPIMVAAVDYDDKNSVEVTNAVQKEVIPELESVEGVASISTAGNVEEKVEVIIREDKIAKMNQKVQDAIDGKLSKAEKKITNGKKKIKSGKSTLDSKQKDAAKKMAEGETKLNEASAQIADGLKEINDQIAKVKEQQTELLAKENEMKTGLAAINKSKATIEQNITKLQSAYDQLSALQKSLNALLEQRTSLYEQIAIEDNATVKAALKSTLNTVEAQIGQIDSQLKANNMTRDSLTSKVNELETNLSKIKTTLADLKKQETTITKSQPAITKAKTQITKGLQKLNAAKNKLQSGKITTEQAREQLDQQKILASIQLSVGQVQLSNGETQIKDAEKQFKEAKKTTKKSSSLENVITTDMVKGILTAENFEMPAGYITEDDVDYLVRVGDDIKDIKSIQDLVIVDYGLKNLNPITLSDVADVLVTDNSDEVYTKINGNQAVALTMEKQSGYSTGDVTNRLLEKFDELQKEKDGIHITTLMNQGVYIDLVVSSVFDNLWMGGLLAVLILLLFLRDWRPTLIVACSIPFSLMSAIVLMYFSGVTMNIISLSGLALGVGMLVDNSIVVIENIYRLRKEGLSAKKAAVEGAKEVAGAIAASTLTTICVFAPIIFTDGITRQLFVDLGLTLAYSLLASLVVALTLVPAMSSSMLRNEKETKDGLLQRVQGIYKIFMTKILRFRILVVLASFILMVLTGLWEYQNGTAFMPDMESTEMSVSLKTEKGVSFAETVEIADKTVAALQEIADVKTVGAMSGGSGFMMGMMSGSSGSGNSITIYAILDEKRTLSNSELEKAVEERTKDIPAEIKANTSGMDMSALGGSGISIQVKGKDLDKLQVITNDIMKKIESVKGLKDITNGLDDGTKEFRISVKKDQAMKYHLTVAQVFQQISAKVAEAKSATKLSTDTKDFDVFVKDEVNETFSQKDIQKMNIEYTTTEGKTKSVKLSNIASFDMAVSPKAISRDAQSRVMTVSADLEDGYNIGLVSDEVRAALKEYKAPDGYEYTMEGEDQSINDSMEQLVLMLVVGILFMFLIMVAQFQSLLSPFIILFTLPLAFTGGFLALKIAGMEFSVIAMIGFVMLSGIIVNNGIVLVDYVNQLRRRGMEKNEAIILAGQTRLRPILMTALTTILGLSTMALGIGMGSDMVQPMAVVTIGGLIYGTILTLVVVPCIYSLLNRKKSMVEEEI